MMLLEVVELRSEIADWTAEYNMFVDVVSDYNALGFFGRLCADVESIVVGAIEK
jgi:hypothetical protein